MFLPKNGLIATGISLLQTLFSFGELTRDFRRYPWYITRDIRRYPWYIPQDITAAISRVIYHGYLRISSCLCHGYRGDAGLNIFNEDWPAETRAGDKDTRRTFTPPEGDAMYSFAREVLIPHLETHLGWKCPVVNVTTFIVVKAGTVDVEKKQCWHRDINLSYVAGPDQHHVICLFPMFCPTPDDGCAGDSVVASHTGLPDPWVEAPMGPLDIGDVWLGNALTVHRGGICPTTNPHRPRVFGFISVGTSRFEYNNTCPVVVPPWASKAAASPEGSQGPNATCGAVGCDVLLDVTDATTVFCVTWGNGGHTMMVRHGPHGGFLMGGTIWPICKGWMPWGN